MGCQTIAEIAEASLESGGLGCCCWAAWFWHPARHLLGGQTSWGLAHDREKGAASPPLYTVRNGTPMNMATDKLNTSTTMCEAMV